MCKYVVLLKFTGQGATHVDRSPERAAEFRAAAAKAGITIDAQFWTVGPYDGVLILNAPDETTAAGLVLGLAKQGHVSTCLLRAFDEAEFKTVLGKMP